jgi:hypothetical protein
VQQVAVSIADWILALWLGAMFITIALAFGYGWRGWAVGPTRIKRCVELAGRAAPKGFKRFASGGCRCDRGPTLLVIAQRGPGACPAAGATLNGAAAMSALQCVASSVQANRFPATRTLGL